jgi:hypothetical protein
MELQDFRDMRLDKQDTLPRVKTGRQPVKCHLVNVLLQSTGILQGSQGMNINYTIDALVLVLKADIVLDGSHVIAQMLPTGRASAGKNTPVHKQNLQGSVTQIRKQPQVKQVVPFTQS